MPDVTKESVTPTPEAKQEAPAVSPAAAPAVAPAASGVSAKLLFGSTYRVMGLVFEKGKPQTVTDAKKLAYLRGLKHVVNVTSDEGVLREERDLFEFSDSGSAGRIRARRA